MIFVKEGLAVLTTGVTDAGIIKSLAADPSEFENGLDLNKVAVGVNEPSHFPYEGGFTFFRYLARQAGDLTVENTTANKTVQTFCGNDSIHSWSDHVKIFSGSGKDRGYTKNDSLRGDAGNDKLFGGAGNDTLWGGKGKDSLWGGDGKDTFIYKPGEGKDTIFDYTNSDMLKIVGGSFSKSKYSGGTLTLTVGNGSVIFKNVAKGDKFNINGKSYKISGSKLK